MNNKYIYIGNDLIAGPLEMDKPSFSNLQMVYGAIASGIFAKNQQEWEEHIASLPKIEVVKEPTHSWEINQILELDKDFYLTPAKWNGHDDAFDWYDIAVPISKPNTDVKENLVASNSANGIDCCDAPVDGSNSVEQEGDEDYSPYCKICEACGYTGCCPPFICKQHPEGAHCEIYLKELNMTWTIYNSLMNWVDERKEQYAELLKRDDELTDENYDKYFPELKQHRGQNPEVCDATGDTILMNDDNKKLKSVKEGERLYSKEEINSLLDFMLKIGFEAGGNGLWIREVDEKGKKNEFKFYTNKQVIEWYNNQKSNQ